MFVQSKARRRTRLSAPPALTMGMIQPEWLYLYHMFREEPEPKPTPREKLPSLPAPKPVVEMRINIRARKGQTVKPLHRGQEMERE
ncbi:MAG: hypothetical protein M0Z65_15395 [Firmicutes bacterium]|uniref:Uncharacterized protein n=1 Tax=Melghirimyces thermohalophilus TaxID=1236220 RepID=A0A1G6MT14_9BACL|nr:hypothetical protein [Melghirimyces thermohalophilus]MDA8354535.1 hypothetical protein [Bacillota bacterium]SDC58116.1 hypothetical protein SAMN04488112_110128 [Melghirimyces thermohalophilus]